jgi:hypothetical protein
MPMSSGDWGASSSEDTERSSSSARDRNRDAAAAATHAGGLVLLYAMSRGPNPEASRAPQAALLASAMKWISDAGQPPQAGGGGNRQAATGATREVRRGEASVGPALEDSRGEANRRITPRIGKGEAGREATSEDRRREADRAATSEDRRREADRGATPEARRGEADRAATSEDRRREADREATSEDRRREADRGATPEVRRGEADRRATLGDRREQANRGASPEARRGANSQPTRGGTPESTGGITPQTNRGITPQTNRGTTPQTNRGTTPQTNRGTTPQVLTGAATQASRGAESQSTGGSSLKIESDPYKNALFEARAFIQKRIQEGKDDLLQCYPSVSVQELPVLEHSGDRNLLQIQNKINGANETLQNLERRLQDLRTGTINPVEEENRRKRRAFNGKIRQVTCQYSDRWVIREKLQQELQRLVGCAEHPDIEDNIWLCTRAIRKVSKAIRDEDLASWKYKTQGGRRQETLRTRAAATQGNEQRCTTGSPSGPFAGAEAVSNLTARSRPLGGCSWNRPERPITDEHEGDEDDDREIFPTKIHEKRAKKRSLTKLSNPKNAKTGAAGRAEAAAKGKATGKRGAARRSGKVGASSGARGGAAAARLTPTSTAAAGKNAVWGEDAGPSAAAGRAERRMREGGADESVTAGLAAGGGAEIGVGAEGDATVAESAGENATAPDHAAPPGHAAPLIAYASPSEGLPAAGNASAATAASGQPPPPSPRTPNRGRKRNKPERSAPQ